MNNLFHRNCFPFRVACRNLIKALCKVKGCTCMTFLQYIQQKFFVHLYDKQIFVSSFFFEVIVVLHFKNICLNASLFQDSFSFNKKIKLLKHFKCLLHFPNNLTVEVGFGTPGTTTYFKATK